MDVICIEDEAFYKLVDQVINRVTLLKQKEDKWISGNEAMQKLRITSKTTLQKLRDEGHIKFSQPEKKIILYDNESINLYLERHSKNIF